MRSGLILPILVFISGIIVERIFCIKLYPVIFLIIAFTVILIFKVPIVQQQKRIFFFLIYVMIFFVGAFRLYSQLIMPTNDISHYVRDLPVEATIIAKVITYPEKKIAKTTKYEFIAEANEILISGNKIPVTGEILVKLFDNNNKCFYGDIIVAKGKVFCPGVKRNPGGFDYAKNLKRKGIATLFTVNSEEDILKLGVHVNFFGKIKLKILQLRNKVESLCDKCLKYPASGIVKAVFLGIKSGIDEKIKEPFENTGTMHIMAISGLHLGLATGLLLMVLNFRKGASLPVYFLMVIFIGLFVVFTGSRIPVLRAGIMFAITMTGRVLFRKTKIFNSMVYAAFIICFLMPQSLFMPEFILSFTAVLAIIFWHERIYFESKQYIKGYLGYLSDLLSLSFVVWVLLMPLLAYIYNTVTPSVIIANIFVIPIIVCLMVMFLVFLLGNCLFGPGLIAFVCAGIVELIAKLLLSVLGAISVLPFSYIKVSTPSLSFIGVYYLFIVGTYVFSGKSSRRSIFIILLLIAVNLFVWNDCIATVPESLKVTFFDVGKGDASIIETASGNVILIDGGTGPGEFGIDAGKRIIAKYLRKRKIKTIDMVILSHPHFDHAGGLGYILENFKVRTFVRGPSKSNFYLEELLNICRCKEIENVLVEKGDKIKIGHDIDINVLHPDKKGIRYDMNNDSLVVKIKDNISKKSILYCGDIEEEGIEALLASTLDINADIIKIPHHGSDNIDIGILKIFINRVNPGYAVITNGKPLSTNNQIIKILKEKKRKINCSGLDGAITFKEDKGMLTINTFVEKTIARLSKNKKSTLTIYD